MPVGWTYREVLETIAFPPSEAPHLWQSNVSKLATQIGMPEGSTGRDIVMFIMQVATAKNEQTRVSELIRSMAGTAKAVERQAFVASMFASAFPNVPLAAPVEGNVSPSVEIDSNGALKRGHDEVGPIPAPSSFTTHDILDLFRVRTWRSRGAGILVFLQYRRSYERNSFSPFPTHQVFRRGFVLPR